VAVLAGLLGPVSIVVVGVLAEDCSKVPFVMRRAAGNLPCSVEDLPDLGPARQAAAILDEDGIGRPAAALAAAGKSRWLVSGSDTERYQFARSAAGACACSVAWAASPKSRQWRLGRSPGRWRCWPSAWIR
jgi:hypothetical protein